MARGPKANMPSRVIEALPPSAGPSANCLAIDGDGFFEQAPGGVIIEREPGSQYTVEGLSSNL